MERDFYALQNVAAVQIPKALALLDSRLAKALEEHMAALPHPVHTTLPAPKPKPVPPQPVRVQSMEHNPLGHPTGLEPPGNLHPAEGEKTNLHPQRTEELPPKNDDELRNKVIGRVVSSEEAQEILISNGMSPARASDYVASFQGPITVRDVEPGESFLRYADDPNSTGSFLTKSTFESPQDAVGGLYLGPYGNTASTVQEVTSIKQSTVLEGQVLNGTPGVMQTVLTDRSAFSFGSGRSF